MCSWPMFCKIFWLKIVLHHPIAEHYVQASSSTYIIKLENIHFFPLPMINEIFMTGYYKPIFITLKQEWSSQCLNSWWVVMPLLHQ